MADIKTLYGNPLRDGLSVHFSADGSGNPVYPEKPSNLIVNADGSIDFGSADGIVLIEDKRVIYANKRWNESNGEMTNGLIKRTEQYIPTEADRIVITDDTKVTGLEILAWDLGNNYVGVWDKTNKEFVKTAVFTNTIDLAELVEAHPTYKYKFNIRPASDAVTIAEIKHAIAFEYKKQKYIAQRISNVDEAILFDGDNIEVFEGYSVNGSNGGVAVNANYVATDYVDVSNRVGNTIEFNASIISNPIGFAIYDKGGKWISGAWGNMSNLEDLGLIRNSLQHVVWTLPEDACYVRACIDKGYYETPSDFGFAFYVSNKGNKAHEDYDRNFITIAHKGYGGSYIADTLQAFIDAAEAGFRAVEIDCRRTADGVYCVSHNASITLYSGGTSASYTIESSNWADLKGKTIDSAGLYPIPTLASVFNSLRKYKMDYFVIDLKTGTNDEIMQIARRCGVAEQVMLSYYSMASFINDLATVQKYPNITVRFAPNGTQAQWEQIRNAIPNMLFADINISEGLAQGYFPKSFTWGIPILCSGVQDSTKNIMAPVAAGAMSQTTLQYSPKDFLDMVALDYNQFPTLTPSVNSISISGTGSTTVTVASSIDDPACWAFGYSSDLTVCDVSQSTFGANASIKVTGVSAGTANLIVFTASGEQLTIPVNVT